MNVTKDQLLLIAGVKAPRAAVVANAHSLASVLAEWGPKYGLHLPHRLAHLIAQSAHESGGYKYDREVWGPTPAQKRYDTRVDLGNTPALDGDGERYKGRGPFQLTGRANYQAFTTWARIGGMMPPDFVAEPDAINSDPWEGLSVIWYWSTRKLNDLADENNIEQITKRVNGGLNGFDDRVHFYTRAALVLLGYELQDLGADIRAFQRKAQAAGLLPADVDGKPSQVDGDAGPKTRAAMHMMLVRSASGVPDTVAAAPVIETKETQVPVAAQGADKVGLSRVLAAAPLLGSPIAAFGGLDNVTKAIVVGAIILAVVALALRGEQIAARTRRILASFGGDA